ncbi:MAG: 3'(2'),5'-bisphosphate nucleotidase CysQ [Deltaproteobacteria bacterium]|nr:MAG: 3'(2'),5'-bisphosphate nucleotidase CysQ [Deltaproteobacteria bacterium]
MSDNLQYLAKAILASIKAGKAILEVYYTDFSVEQKADNSPLTLADRKSHKIIAESLKELDIPILSEEGKEIPFEERLNWNTLWIVDPLDGTREFVKRNDEFTVNVALVKDGKPFLGVIFVPVKKTLYFAAQNLGAYKFVGDRPDDWFYGKDTDTEDSSLLNRLIDQSVKLPLHSVTDSPFIIVGSRSHGRQELEAFVDQKRNEYDRVEFISAGSSIKFCLVAEGSAHIYPRFGPTSEWDTAAGQAIVENAGGEVVDYNTGMPLVYNKEDILNPWFIVRR